MSEYVRVDRLEEIERQVRNLVKYAKESAVHVPSEVLEPYDGKPALRPHSIPGWWQVWSGGICIALLSPEEALPVTEELRGRLRNAEDALRERIEPRGAMPPIGTVQEDK